jgi:hypothetical protein
MDRKTTNYFQTSVIRYEILNYLLACLIGKDYSQSSGEMKKGNFEFWSFFFTIFSCTFRLQ